LSFIRLFIRVLFVLFIWVLFVLFIWEQITRYVSSSFIRLIYLQTKILKRIFIRIRPLADLCICGQFFRTENSLILKGGAPGWGTALYMLL
jgi:hypothetical protein